MSDKFAKWIFLIAGIYGVLVLIPQFFMIETFGLNNPPNITHPEFYFGFNGLALAWQIAFFIISSNPVKYRLLMIPSILEKLFFVFSVSFLYFTEGMNQSIIAGAAIDLILGVGFAIAFIRTKE